MKPILRNIVISLILAVLGLIWLGFTLANYQGWISTNTLIWYLLGILIVHLSLSVLVSVYVWNTVYSRKFKILLKTSIISFNVTLLGIFVGLIVNYSGHKTPIIMTWYWLLMLVLYLISIISLVMLVNTNPNNSNYTRFCEDLMMVSIIFNLGPVLWTIFYMFIGNAMNSSA
ncbi:DUF3902 family protein [Bacillus thuringiensis]|uniref:DUF3902 family protein n=1 Tax=Bacillus thuringiensis TaxID=1428 RepID=UPI000CF9995E|nr:DUF3902 family protein [Bacillus thuringiensis]PQQ47324.1 hypothetical protein C6A34_12520 [Bacillus thuringiensis]